MQLIHIPGPVMMDTNTFLLFTEGRHAIAIDPAANAQKYLKELPGRGATLKAIFLTHGHYDHVGAARELAARTGAEVYLDPADVKGDRLYPLRPADGPFKIYPPGGRLVLDELTFQFWHTPGHTAGSWCIYVKGLLFTSDTLFAGSCGRVDLEGGAAEEMQKSLALLKALPLPDETRVFPGHGSFTTLGAERDSNPYMQEV